MMIQLYLASLAFAHTLMPGQHLPAPAAQDRTAEKLGSCISQEGINLMSRMLTIENDSVWHINGSPVSATLNRESITFYVGDSEYGRSERVDWLVGGNSQIDIELSFASVDNQIALYWKETYKHRIYSQGILKIDGSALSEWCRGRGGLEYLS